MEIWQWCRMCVQRSSASAVVAALLAIPCAANAELIRVVDLEGDAVSTWCGTGIEPAVTEAFASSRSSLAHRSAIRQAPLCDVWTEPTLRVATWQRAKSCGKEGELQDLHLAPEPSAAVLALLGVVLGWRRWRSKLCG